VLTFDGQTAVKGVRCWAFSGSLTLAQIPTPFLGFFGFTLDNVIFRYLQGKKVGRTVIRAILLRMGIFEFPVSLFPFL